MRQIFNIFRLFILGVWSFLCIIFATTCYIFYPFSKLMVWYTQHLWGPGVIVLWNTKLRSFGQENIQEGVNYIIMVNHCSFLDVPCLGREVPIRQYYIAKKELKQIPLLGWFMRLAGMIFIDRSNRQKSIESIEKAAKLIRASKSVVIFPEGTASRDGKIGVFKKGGFHLALQSKAPILPVRIEGTGQIWPRGNILRSKGGKVKLTIGKPIRYEDYGGWEVNEFSKNVRQVLIDLGD
jgi:1-acyl-sn-glycerol-3-phosphate acyltransferase